MFSIESLISEGLNNLDIPFSHGEKEQIMLFIGEIERWNKRFNLVKAEGREIAVNHILDSLSGFHVIDEIKKRLPEEPGDDCTLLDIGSGAGFPGIPLAVFFKDIKFFLLERSQKRATFLENTILLLDLNNATVINDDLSNVNNSYNIVCFRAFSRIRDIIPDLKRLVSPRGTVVAYKGRLSTVVDEIAGMGDSFKYNQVIQVSVPFLNAERYLIVANEFVKKDK